MSGLPLLAIPLFHPTERTSQFLVAALLSTVLFVGVMWALHRLPSQGKKWLMIITTFLAGMYFTLEFFLPGKAKVPGAEPENFITPTVDPVSMFITNMMIFLFALGIVSLVIVHGKRLVQRRAGWHNSVALFLAMISVTVVGFMTSGGENGSHVAQLTYNSLYFGLLVGLESAMFSLLAFYIASAAYRAFRVRTVEAGLLMAAALIVMLGMVNFGVKLTSWIGLDSPAAFFRVELLTQWLLSWVNGAAYRAVVIGVEVGALAMAIRLWLSLERGTFFSQE